MFEQKIFDDFNENQKFDVFKRLKNYIEKNEYRGWDPYDGLKSNIFDASFFSNIELFRILWTQFIKRFPINLRDVLKIDKDYNPKSLALVLHGYCNVYNIKNLFSNDEKNKIKESIKFLTKKLLQLKNHQYSGACWGYEFDWNSKAFFLPKHTPTVVCTTFVLDALVKAYTIIKSEELKKCIISVGDFITKDLNKIKKSNNSFVLSYSPIDHRAVYNASLLGAKSLALINKLNKKLEHNDFAHSIVEAACKMQLETGAFIHSDQVGIKWRDNFHTGFKLECLSIYQNIFEDYTFDKNLKLGFNYWINNFFLDDGTPKYYDNDVFPIDLHTVGQMVPTIYHFGKMDKYKNKLDKTIDWSIKNMFDKENGFFYFQKTKFYTNKIDFMRWPNAWMFYGLSFYFKFLSEK